MQERLGIAGAGVVACGLAATAAAHDGDVLLWARSERSAERARASVARVCAKANPGSADAERIRVVTDFSSLAEATFLVEAVVEHHGSKAALLTDLAEMTALAGGEGVLATTTSSLSIAALADASGRPERFLGLHVFNPVPRMPLVELVFPDAATEPTRQRARRLCEDLGKVAVEVPDIPGFVVNRLLFPYLFGAVELQAQTGMEAADIDRCMTLGAGLPMGPLALLDLVGLDVSASIGDAIGVAVPATVRRLVAEGALGRKAGRGFYSYD
ncbi:MAG: 3-hydroxyacyl-CoA dehydrogenase family protein [Actinomycetota bacterium]|nr:3-hydroxyacyl-CoA dehydrogenase family protein [Actinomycetota bacterium]